MMARLSRLLADERGTSVVEMAVITPTLALLLAGTVDVSLAITGKLNLEQAAQRAIEMTQRTDYTTTMNSTIESVAEAAAGTGSDATVTSWLECANDHTHLDYDTGTCTNASDPYARYVRVSITQSYTPYFGVGTSKLLGAGSDGKVTLQATAGVRTQ